QILIMASLTPSIPQLVPCVFAQDQVLPIKAQDISPKQQRRVLLLALNGQSTLPTGTVLRVRLGHAEQFALESTVIIENGQFTGQLEVRGLLLPDEYFVEYQIAEQQPEWLAKSLSVLSYRAFRQNFRLGSTSEQSAAN